MESIERALGRIEGKLDGLGVQQELTRAAVEQQGKTLAALPCRLHQRRISDLFAAVGVAQEVTGEIEMAEVRRLARWNAAKTVGKVVLGLGAVTTAVVGLLTLLGG